jgi:hypothetical protein
MKATVRGALAAGAVVLTLAMAAGSLALAALNLGAGATFDSAAGGQLVAELMLGSSFAVVGWLIASRRAGNPLGWIYLAIGLSQVGEAFLALAALYGLVAAPGSIPGADFLAWLGVFGWVPGFGLFMSFSLLLFPTGRLPSRRWRPVAWLAVVAMVLLGTPTAIAAWSHRGPDLISDSVTVPEWANTLQAVGLLLMTGVAIASVGSIVVRFRHSSGLERQQLKWFTWAVAPAVAALVLSANGYSPIVWVFVAFVIAPLLPLAVGIAVLRYRLYEIDRIVSRTIGWAIVTGTLVAVFALVVVGLQALLAPWTENNTLAVAASTLVAAALFAPLRGRVQRAVDRRFNRSRVDAERAVSAFASQARDGVDLGQLRLAVVTTARGAVAPSTAQLWMRDER